MANTLNTLNAATLAALGKLVADAAKGNRDNLDAGAHAVSETVSVDVTATVNVGDDYEQRIVGKAKPWNLYTALLGEANKQLAAAGVAGIDLDKVVAAAEQIEPKLAKAAKEEADGKVAETKAPTLTECKGKVTIKGTVGLAGESLEATGS